MILQWKIFRKEVNAERGVTPARNDQAEQPASSAASYGSSQAWGSVVGELPEDPTVGKVYILLADADPVDVQGPVMEEGRTVMASTVAAWGSGTFVWWGDMWRRLS